MSPGSNPFEGMPFFGDLLKMLGTQGPVQWDGARQLALSIATGGEGEPNVDPTDRIFFEQLTRIAELQVGQATGLNTSPAGGALQIQPVNRSTWALSTLEAYKPLIETMAQALRPPAGNHPSQIDPADELMLNDSGDGDPTEAWLAQIMGLLSPMLLGMTTGSLVGHLATRSFGLYDLPIPRPPSDEISVVAPNINAFADDWSMDLKDLQLWVCLHQLTNHAVLGVPHVRARMNELLLDYAGAFSSDPDALATRFTAGVQATLDRHDLPWSVVQLGARAEYRFARPAPRTGTESAAAGDDEVEEYLHLALANRGILLTPFHNMALMCPETSEADVDLHTEVFAAIVGAVCT